ncbi:glycosyltransferase [Vibrio natriegens]
MTVYVGRLPPPVGGVSVFWKRMIDNLNKMDGDILIDFSNKFWWLKLLCIRLRFRQQSYVFNTCNIWVLLLINFYLISSRSIIYDHNGSRHYTSGLKAIFFVILTHKINEIRIVHKHLANNYLLSKRNKLKVFIPFIPPSLSYYDEIVNDYNDEILSFIHSHRKVILINASKYTIDNMGRDVYGIDKAVFLINTLEKKFPSQYSMLFVIGDDKDFKVKNLLERRVSNHNSYLYVSGNYELWPLFKMVDLFIRPTTTDGDSVSIREALYLNCPVVASNVVPRPDDVVTFNLFDNDEMYKNVKSII